jgi:hypothetical protein
VHSANEPAGAASDHPEAKPAIFALTGRLNRHSIVPRSFCQTQHSAVRFIIRAGFCEIIESMLCGVNNVSGYERRTFSRSLFAALDTTLPFENRPAGEVILRKLRKNGGEIHLAITKRSETARPRNPGLIPAINSLPPARPELCVFHMKHFYSTVIDINEFEIIKLLENEMAGIVQNIAAFVPSNSLQKHIEAYAVMQIFAGVQFKT